jgi:hypothetical protein
MRKYKLYFMGNTNLIVILTEEAVELLGIRIGKEYSIIGENCETGSEIIICTKYIIAYEEI